MDSVEQLVERLVGCLQESPEGLIYFENRVYATVAEEACDVMEPAQLFDLHHRLVVTGMALMDRVGAKSTAALSQLGHLLKDVERRLEIRGRAKRDGQGADHLRAKSLVQDGGVSPGVRNMLAPPRAADELPQDWDDAGEFEDV